MEAYAWNPKELERVHGLDFLSEEVNAQYLQAIKRCKERSHLLKDDEIEKQIRYGGFSSQLLLPKWDTMSLV